MSCTPGPHLVSGVQELMGLVLTKHSSCKQSPWDAAGSCRATKLRKMACSEGCPSPRAGSRAAALATSHKGGGEHQGIQRDESPVGIKQVAGLPMLSSTMVEKVGWRTCVASLSQVQVGEKGGSMQALVGKAGKQAVLIAWQGWQSRGRTCSLPGAEEGGRDHADDGSGGAA